MKKLYGWDYFETLEKNKPQIGRSINDTVTMLKAGERPVAAGATADPAQASRGNPIGVLHPSDGRADHRAVRDHEGLQASQRRQAVHGIHDVHARRRDRRHTSQDAHAGRSAAGRASR